MRAREHADVVVIGGGIIGLAVAWRLRALASPGAADGAGRDRAGEDRTGGGRTGGEPITVTVLERERVGAGASSVAAGMLAPAAEAEFGERGRMLLELGAASAGLWPGFAEELGRASGVAVALGGSETLYVARDSDEAAELERQLEFRRSLGLRVERLRASEAREREPALAPTIRMALLLAGERTVDPRQVLDALRAACARADVRLREGADVEGLELADGGTRVAGVRLRGGEVVEAGRVVLAAGAWASELAGVGAAGGRPVVRPVRGQILRLRDPAGPGLLGGVVRFSGGYLVPRGDGRYVLGATVEDRGFERAPTAGAVHGLLCDARELVPGIDELEIEELAVGFRPGTPDNLPLLGHGAIDGLVWAAGHYRNGVLLAPVTAELIAGVLGTDGTAPSADAATGGPPLDGEERARMLAACSPARFVAEANADAETGAAHAGAPVGAGS